MEKSASITLTLTDWNYVLGLVGQRPITEAVNLFFSMRSQVEQQAAAQSNPAAEPAPVAAEQE